MLLNNDEKYDHTNDIKYLFRMNYVYNNYDFFYIHIF